MRVLGAGYADLNKVTVGGSAGLVYSPNTLEANVGDMVIFTFLSANHTATQSAFTSPCVKLAGGKDSGFMPNLNDSVVPPPQMAMQVTVTTPLCKPPIPPQATTTNIWKGSIVDKKVTAERA
jgi:plastocyanin